MSNLETMFNAARQRVLNGEELSIEEQAELVKAIRAGRFTAAEAGVKARTERKTTAAAKKGMSDDDLDASLGDLGL